MFAKEAGSSGFNRLPSKKRVHVFPDLGYEVKYTSSGNTVAPGPAASLPVSRRMEVATASMVLLTVGFLTCLFRNCPIFDHPERFRRALTSAFQDPFHYFMQISAGIAIQKTRVWRISRQRIRTTSDPCMLIQRAANRNDLCSHVCGYRLKRLSG